MSRRKPIIEPFNHYPGPGKPWLALYRNPKWSHVAWSDGTLFHYPDFHHALYGGHLRDTLTAVMQHNADRFRSHSSLSGDGGAGGAATNWPTDLAELAFSIVRAFFNDALTRPSHRIDAPLRPPPANRFNHHEPRRALI